MRDRSRTVLPATHTFIYKQNEPYLRYSQLWSVTALWLVLVFHSAEGRRLIWPEWLVANGLPRWFISLQMVTHPGNNHAWLTVTSLIEANALPLSQASIQDSVNKAVLIFTKRLRAYVEADGEQFEHFVQ